MKSGAELRDESLARISALAQAMQHGIHGQAVVEILYPDMNPTTALLDLTTVNSLVRILGGIYVHLVQASTHEEADPTRESKGEDHAGGGIASNP